MLKRSEAPADNGAEEVHYCLFLLVIFVQIRALREVVELMAAVCPRMAQLEKLLDGIN